MESAFFSKGYTASIYRSFGQIMENFNHKTIFQVKGLAKVQIIAIYSNLMYLQLLMYDIRDRTSSVTEWHWSILNTLLAWPSIPSHGMKWFLPQNCVCSKSTLLSQHHLLRIRCLHCKGHFHFNIHWKYMNRNKLQLNETKTLHAGNTLLLFYFVCIFFISIVICIHCYQNNCIFIYITITTYISITKILQ